MRIWLLVLALAVAAAGVVLFVLARERPAEVTVTPHAAAPAPPAPSPPPPSPTPAPEPSPPAAPAAGPHAAVASDATPAAELETLRSTGTSAEPWVPQATTLLHGFDPAATVECYVAGCAATLAFDSEDAYEHAVEVIREDETWTGGKKWLSPISTGGKVSAVLILYRPD